MRAIVAGLVTVCLGLLGYIGAVKMAPSILSDLAERADHALLGRVAGVRPIEVDDERRAILKGQVRSEADKSAAERIIAGLAGIAEVDNQLVVDAGGPGGNEPSIDAKLADVFFVLTWDGGHLSASGKLPNDTATAMPRALATQFPSAALTIDIAPLATTAVPELAPVLDCAGRALSVARRGKVEIRGAKFVLDAVYGSPEAESSARALVTEKVGIAFRATLSTRVELAQAEAAAPDAGPVADVQDAVEMADGSEVEASDLGEIAVGDGATVGDEGGDGNASDGEVVGDAGPEVADAGDVSAASDGGETAGDAGVVDPGGVLTPKLCKALIDGIVVREKRIVFKGAKEITPESDAKIQQIAALLARCPDAKTTVSGYHDDYGEPDHLRALTGMRANAVYKRLIELGIDKARLKWRGMGFANMRFSTGRQETRVLNQRIEFDIMGAP